MDCNDQKLTPLYDVYLIGACLSHLDVIRLFKQSKKKIFKLTLIHSTGESLLREFLPAVVSGNLALEDLQIDLGHLCLDSGVSFFPERILDVDLKNRLIFTENQKLTFDMILLPGKFYSEGLETLAVINRNFEKCPNQLLFKGETLLSCAILLALRKKIDPSIPIKLISSTCRWPSDQVKKMKTQLASQNIQLVTEDRHPYSSIHHLDGAEPHWYKKILSNDPACLGPEGHHFNALNLLPASWTAEESDLFSRSCLFELKISRTVGRILWWDLNRSVGCGRSTFIFPRLKLITDIIMFKLTRLGQRPWPLREQTSYFYKRAQKKLAEIFQKKSLNHRNETFLESGICTDIERTSLDILMGTTDPRVKSPSKSWDTTRFDHSQSKSMDEDKRFKTSVCHANLGFLTCANTELFSEKKTGFESPLILTEQEPIKNRSQGQNRLSSLKKSDLMNGRHLLQRMESITFNHLGPFWGGALLAKICSAGFELSGMIPQKYLVTLELPAGAENMLLRNHDLFCQGVLWYFRTQNLTSIQCQLKAGMNSNAQMTLQGVYESIDLMKDCNDESYSGPEDIIITKPLGRGVVFEAYPKLLLSTSEFWRGLHIILRQEWPTSAILDSFQIVRGSIIGPEGSANALKNLLVEGEMAQINLDLIQAFPGVVDALKKNFRTQRGKTNKSVFKEQLLGLNPRKEVASELLFCDETAGSWIILAPKSKSHRLLVALKDSGLKQATIVGESFQTNTRTKYVNFD